MTTPFLGRSDAVIIPEVVAPALISGTVRRRPR